MQSMKFEDARGVTEVSMIGKGRIGNANDSGRDSLAKGTQNGREVVTTELQEGLGAR